MYYRTNSVLLVGVLLLLGTAGCGQSTTPGPDSPIDGHDEHDAHAQDHAAAHSDTGPHGGHLIELGRNHEYHAELLEDDAAESVAVYILDSEMNELAVQQEAIGLTFVVEGHPTAFQLAAVDNGQGSGASRFESSDKLLFELLEHSAELEGKIRVTIEGVPYVGGIHHHGHADDHATAHEAK
jgi:hypothetical protein